MSERVPIDPERLLAQTAWVRRLARSLARDEASADDLVQETFAAALRRPPSGAHDEPRLRAWFGFVLRNMAFRRTRSEARREERERRSMDGGRTDHDERADELEELRAELFRHVKSLPELSREVVLLRYFEELDSAEIARRLGLPDSTVRNRLRRALAELRERLEREHGSDWRNLCLFVLPNPRTEVAGGGAVAAAAGGGLWLVGGGLAAAALAMLAWLAWTGEEQSRAPMPIDLALAAATDAPRGERERSTPERSPLESAAPRAEGGLGAPRETGGIRLTGRVLDERGSPASDFSLSWYDEGATVLRAVVSPGGYAVEGLHPGTWSTVPAGEGWRGEPIEVEIDERTPEQQHDLRLRASAFVPVYLEDPAGRTIERPVLRGASRRPIDRLDVRAAPAGAEARLVARLALDLPREQGCARFRDWQTAYMQRRGAELPPGAFGMLELYEDPPLSVALFDGTRVVAERELRDTTQELHFTLAPEELDAAHTNRLSGIRLRLRMPDGRPPPSGSRIILRGPTTEVLQLDGDGRGAGLGLEPGGWLIAARLPGVGMLRIVRELRPGEVEELGDLFLLQEMKLQLRFQLPPDADNFVRFRLQREASGDPLRTLASPDGFEQRAFHGGRIDVDWPGPGSYLLRVIGIGEAPPEGEKVVRNDYRAGARPLRLELGAAPPGEVRVSVEHTTTVVLRPARSARGPAIWLLETDDGLPCQLVETEGRAPQVVELVPGGYRIARLDDRTGAPELPQPFVVGAERMALELAP